jgi:hypothetical protein
VDGVAGAQTRLLAHRGAAHDTHRVAVLVSVDVDEYRRSPARAEEFDDLFRHHDLVHTEQPDRTEKPSEIRPWHQP